MSESVTQVQCLLSPEVVRAAMAARRAERVRSRLAVVTLFLATLASGLGTYVYLADGQVARAEASRMSAVQTQRVAELERDRMKQRITDLRASRAAAKAAETAFVPPPALPAPAPVVKGKGKGKGKGTTTTTTTTTTDPIVVACPPGKPLCS